MQFYCDFGKLAGSMVEWLKHHAYDKHSLGSEPTCIILLRPWERHFMPLFLPGSLGKQF